MPCDCYVIAMRDVCVKILSGVRSLSGVQFRYVPPRKLAHPRMPSRSHPAPPPAALLPKRTPRRATSGNCGGYSTEDRGSDDTGASSLTYSYTLPSPTQHYPPARPPTLIRIPPELQSHFTPSPRLPVRRVTTCELWRVRR